MSPLPLALLAFLLPVARADADALPPDVDPLPAESPLDEAAPEPPAPAPTLEEVWAAMPPEELLDAAIQRRSLGDVPGARERLQVLEQAGALPALTTYHLAICDELDEDYIAAHAGYDTLIQRWPDLPLADDARYRRAIVLEDLGEHAEAAAVVKDLQRRGKWSENDALSMQLVRGSAEVRAGVERKGLERKGIKRIERALAELAGRSELSWAQARARHALAEAQLRAASRVEIRNDRKARKNLVARVQFMEGAQDQVIAIAQLGEPEYALAGLMALGDAYLALHDDMLAAPPPPGLSGEQVQIYQAELEKQVDVLTVKAWRYYDEGVSLATRIQWQGHLAQQLRERRDALATDA